MPAPGNAEHRKAPQVPAPAQRHPKARLLFNRVNAVAIHAPWYGFRMQSRLARDAGVSESAVSRLVRGRSTPSLTVALRVTGALARRLGKPLDVFEVFSLDGNYPTRSICDLCGCPDCLPPQAYDDEENLRPEFMGVAAGEWALDAVSGAGGRS